MSWLVVINYYKDLKEAQSVVDKVKKYGVEGIAVKADVPKSLIADCISSMVEKGINFVRSFYNDKLFLKLDPQFKEEQAKQNTINLSLHSFI